MNRKYAFAILLLVIAAFLLIGMQQSGEPKITVLNPAIESKMVNREPLGPRLDTIDGKTIYMVDISWGGPDAARVVFEEMTAWFAQHHPTVKTIIKRKTGMYTQDDPQLWKEIAANGNAAIIGVSG